jgi:tetratricopeptide (TPR) repeat protein
LAATARQAEATSLLHRELTILEGHFSPKHPHVAACLNELAELARAAGRFAEAEPLYRRALDILEESYGKEHPHVASCLNNLALTLGALNQSVEAQELFARALVTDVQIFGREHPKVSNRLNNLAWLLRRNGQLAEAEPLYRQSLEILLKFESRTGHKHTTWETTFSNYAELLLEEMGETEETVKRRYAAIIQKVNKEIALTGQ